VILFQNVIAIFVFTTDVLLNKRLFLTTYTPENAKFVNNGLIREQRKSTFDFLRCTLCQCWIAL